MTDRVRRADLDRVSSELLRRAARARKRTRRVGTLMELVASVALVVSIAAILTVFTMRSAGAAALETLSLSEPVRIAIVVALGFIMIAMSGLTAAMIRRTVSAHRRPRRRR